MTHSLNVVAKLINLIFGNYSKRITTFFCKFNAVLVFAFLFRIRLIESSFVKVACSVIPGEFVCNSKWLECGVLAFAV